MRHRFCPGRPTPARQFSPPPPCYSSRRLHGGDFVGPGWGVPGGSMACVRAGHGDLLDRLSRQPRPQWPTMRRRERRRTGGLFAIPAVSRTDGSTRRALWYRHSDLEDDKSDDRKTPRPVFIMDLDLSRMGAGAAGRAGEAGADRHDRAHHRVDRPGHAAGDAPEIFARARPAELWRPIVVFRTRRIASSGWGRHGTRSGR